MPEKKIAIVTGANTGLGLALVRHLLQAYGEEMMVYLTARDMERGQSAIQQLQQEGLQPAFHLLDVADDTSVAAFAEYIQQTHGGYDVMLSNAAARISPDIPQADQVETFINTNNYGTHRMITAFGPLLRDHGRFVVVASSFGSLRHLNPALHDQFNVSQLTLDDIQRVLDQYAAQVRAGTAVAHGWPEWINVPSKIGQVAAMKVFARDMQASGERRDVLINAVCPGLVDTAASRPWFSDMSQAQSPDVAAVDVVWLATLPADTLVPYSELVQFRRALPFW